MLKKKKPEAAASAGKRFLRVQAEGAQGIHGSDSKFSLDAKPDPYVVFVLDNSRMFALEFADDKFKKRKDSGEVKLTIALIEEDKPLKQPAEQAAKEAPPMPVPAPVPAEAPPPKEPTDSSVLSLTATNAKQAELPENGEVLKPVDEKKPAETQSALDRQQQEVNPPPVVSSPPPDSIPKSPTSAVEGKGKAATPRLDALEHQPTKLNSDTTEPQKSAVESTVVVLQAEPTSQPDQKPSQNLVTPVAQVPATASIVEAMKVELVSARNLTRPVSFGAIFDRRPDPLVTLEFYGMKKSSVALKDVDIKKPVVWNQVMLSFDLPHTATSSLQRKGVSPMDLIIHVKDENLLKPTYMGGTKVSLAEFFLDREESG
ncbi:hypothetical protein FI667_g10598, partial [Globisporangium splendens]